MFDDPYNPMLTSCRARDACPVCGVAFVEPELDDRWSWFFWTARLGGHDYECTCRNCGWEFTLDPAGNVVDDGDLDDASPFEIQENAFEIDDALEMRHCPCCARRIESEPALCLTCPWCRTDFAANAVDSPVPNPYHHHWDDYDEEPIGCPNCGSDGDIDGEPMTALGGGRTICHACDCEFFLDDSEAWAEPRDKILRLTLDRAPGGKRFANALGRMYGVRKMDVLLDAGPHSGTSDINVPRVRLRGTAAVEDVRLLHRLRFFGSDVLLTGLSLTAGVSFNGCRVRLRDCIIKGPIDAIGCAVTMQRCQLMSRAHGLALYQGSSLRMRDVELRDCGDTALLIETGSTARLSDVRIVGGQGDGIRLRLSNRLVMRRGKIYAKRGSRLARPTGSGRCAR